MGCLFDNRPIYCFVLCCMIDLHYPDIGQTLVSVVNEREQKPVIALEMETNRKQVIAHLCYYFTLQMNRNMHSLMFII